MSTAQPREKPRSAADESLDDAVWSALNDRTRRAILDLLRGKSMTTGQLCEHFETTRFAVMKHLKALQKAGLVIVERQGRERINHLNAVPIQTIYRRWIKPFEQLSADRLLKLKRIAELATE